MLKGSQRKMIKLCGCSNTIFEEAYFILKPDVMASERDVLSEANRIISENSSFSGNQNKRCVRLSVFAFTFLIILASLGICACILLFCFAL